MYFSSRNSATNLSFCFMIVCHSDGGGHAAMPLTFEYVA